MANHIVNSKQITFYIFVCKDTVESHTTPVKLAFARAFNNCVVWCHNSKSLTLNHTDIVAMGVSHTRTLTSSLRLPVG